MNFFEPIYILFLIFSILCVIFLIVYKVAQIVESKKQPPEKEFIKTNMEEDFKFLYKLLDDYTVFVCVAYFVTNSDGSSIINGKEFDAAVDVLCKEVYETLSNEYVDLLKLYVDKFEEYLYEQCYDRVKSYVKEINKYAIGKTMIKDRRIQ